MKKFFLQLCLMMVFSGLSHSATITWGGAASSQWHNDNNWIGGIKPGITDYAIINGGAFTVDVSTVETVQGVRIINGDLNVLDTGRLNLQGASFPGLWMQGFVNNQGIINVSNINHAGILINSGSLMNSGVINISTVLLDGILINGGTFVNIGTVTSTELIDIQGGLLSGSGQITADVMNAGGQVRTATGSTQMVIDGTFTQKAEAVLFANIGGIDEMDFNSLSISLDAFLDGRLSVILVNGFIPDLGDTFDIIITGNSVIGNFTPSEIQFPVFSGKTFEISYTENRVTLTTVSLPVPLPAIFLLLLTE